MNTCLLGVAVLVLITAPGSALPGKDRPPPPAERKVRTFGSQERDPTCNYRNFLFSPEVVADPARGTIRLAHSVLVADEMGATDFRQGETLSDRVRAKKVVVLDRAESSKAELFLFGSVRDVTVNGQKVGPPRPLVSTGWTRVAVPPSLLKQGENEVVLSGGGGLLLEPGRQPGRSWKSTDGGKTWSRTNLGAKNNLRGEYLVRLRVGQYARRGWVKTPVFDLWAPPGGGIATPGKLGMVESLAALRREQPPGTKLVPWLRTGSTPAPEARTWTDWVALDRDYHPNEPAWRHRWAQLKFELATTVPQATPALPARLDLVYLDFDPNPAAKKDKIEVVTTGATRPARGSVPFVYQAPSPRLKLLRERYQLDKVIAPGKTEMEQLMLLRHWVRNQWHTAWGSHPASWMPPWDALMILSSKDQADCLTMCTHYAAVYVQCCLALGWTARHCIVDHHCTAEVWVNQYNKWAMMDAGNSAERADCTLHFERKGVPLSALELHVAHTTKQTKGITVHFTPARLMQAAAPLCRPAPPSKTRPAPRPDVVPLADLPKYPVCGLTNYRRYAFPARNNYLDSLYPGELYQGWSEYYYDGYCWVGDSPDDPTISPEYSRHLTPSRPQDIDWKVNWTRIHLARTAKPGELHVDLETFTPNLVRLETAEGKEWKPTAATFVWKLKPGDNRLRVRSVNQFGRPGVEDSVHVRWSPAR